MGRPKGSLNKVTKDTKELIKDLIDNNVKVIQKDLDQLEPIQRLNIIVKLLQYVLPMPKDINISTQEDFPILDLSQI